MTIALTESVLRYALARIQYGTAWYATVRHTYGTARYTYGTAHIRYETQTQIAEIAAR